MGVAASARRPGAPDGLAPTGVRRAAAVRRSETSGRAVAQVGRVRLRRRCRALLRPLPTTEPPSHPRPLPRIRRGTRRAQRRRPRPGRPLTARPRRVQVPRSRRPRPGPAPRSQRPCPGRALTARPRRVRAPRSQQPRPGRALTARPRRVRAPRSQRPRALGRLSPVTAAPGWPVAMRARAARWRPARMLWVRRPVGRALGGRLGSAGMAQHRPVWRDRWWRPTPMSWPRWQAALALGRQEPSCRGAPEVVQAPRGSRQAPLRWDPGRRASVRWTATGHMCRSP